MVPQFHSTEMHFVDNFPWHSYHLET
uniref:Uncharacterized protein n=1 Tax=Arundo donax TaxID=35708 RepID=A0A0A9EVI3_ARUDO